MLVLPKVPSGKYRISVDNFSGRPHKHPAPSRFYYPLSGIIVLLTKGMMMDSGKIIIKADMDYRRKLLLSYLAAILIGIIMWNFCIPPLMEILENLPNKERVETKETIIHLFLFSFIPVAIYVIVIGRRACKYKAMPYPGMKVIRDTVVVTGKKAIFQGRGLMILGTVVIVLTVASMIANHLIIFRFKQNPMFRSVFYGMDK